jgi:hypothetical protein
VSTELKVKQHIVQMLAEGFVVFPCANPECEQLFASDTYCAGCEENEKEEE